MMGARMTSIHLPGLFGSGIAEWGRKTPEEMTAALKAYAARQIEHAQAILEAADSDFRVETYTGVNVQRNTDVLQVGRPSDQREAS